MAEKQWIPLESNPEVLTKFGHALGISPLLSLTDVWSLDPNDNMLPSPCFAVILLFPLTDKIEGAARAAAEADVETDAAKAPFFCKQTIGNACGTIALLHAGINARVAAAPLVEGSFFAGFESRTRDMTAEERAAALQADDSLDAVHGQFAQEGQTAAPAAHEKVDMHFVCFVEHEGTLYELDGRKAAPVKHGAASGETLMAEAGKVIQEKFMSLDPSEHRFTTLALTMGME